MSFFNDNLYILGNRNRLYKTDTISWQFEQINEPIINIFIGTETSLTGSCKNRLHTFNIFNLYEITLNDTGSTARIICENLTSNYRYFYGLTGVNEYIEYDEITETEITVNGDKENDYFDFCIDDTINISGNTPLLTNLEQNEWFTISSGDAVEVTGDALQINVPIKQVGVDTIVYSFVSGIDGCVSTDTVVFNISDYPNHQVLGDSFICDNQTTTLFLETDTNTLNVDWYFNDLPLNNSLDSLSGIYNEGDYWATLDNTICKAIVSDTFRLKVHELTQPIISTNSLDNIYCIDEPIQVYVNDPEGDETISWYADDSTVNISSRQTVVTNESSGVKMLEYSIELLSQNCKKSTSISIDVLDYPIIELIGDSLICENEEALMHFYTDQSNLNYYLIKDDEILVEKDTLMSFSETGNYQVSASNRACPEVFSNIISLHVDTLPNADILLNDESEDIIIIEGDIINVKTTDLLSENRWKISSSDYLFTDNTIDEDWSSDDNIGLNIISLYSQNGVCETVDSVEIYVKAKLNAPNVFSPNGDGINETFRIRGIETHFDSYVQIFNRWGNLVFRSDDYSSNEWNGGALSSGVYYYIIKTEQNSYTGAIHLIR